MQRKRQETRTVEVLAEVTCDLCGATSPTDEWVKKEGADKWTCRDTYTTTLTIESQTITTNDYGEGHGSTYAVDLCPACFDGKVVPFLKSLGCTVTPREFDF